MEGSKQDGSILTHIEKLTAREEELFLSNDLTDAQVKELDRIQVELDQYWDLLRQRRALRDAGKDPRKAAIRPADQIENYEN